MIPSNIAFDIERARGRESVAGRRRAGAALPLNSFLRQVDRLLRQLRDVHIRISVARLSAAGRRELGASQAILDKLHDPCVLAGIMPDGGIAIVFVGPRGDSGPAGDHSVGDRIVLRLQQAVAAAGLPGFEPARDLAIRHCWTDEIGDIAALLPQANESRAAIPGRGPKSLFHPINA